MAKKTQMEKTSIEMITFISNGWIEINISSRAVKGIARL